MNRWAVFLAQTPPTLQRLIASAQRISIPRTATPAERLARLRQALCHAATVRATYFTLTAAEQQALQVLRHLPRGLAAPALAARFGPIRSLTELRADRTPRSISEHLLLLGWLLPRPATRKHPTRYLLAPELRTWLPVPLSASAPPPACPLPPAADHAPDRSEAPAVHAATIILTTAAAVPLPLCRDGRPTQATLHRLRPRLAPIPAATAEALLVWLFPLLSDLGLLAPHGAAAVSAPGAARFLRRSADDRRDALRTAWEAAPRPDAWLAPLRVSTRGLDWPALRRRLSAWACALSPADAADAAAAYPRLQAAFGPLADAQTHGLAGLRQRTPWLPRRAAAVWAAAVAGPLAWLDWLPGAPPLAVADTPGGDESLDTAPDAPAVVVAAPDAPEAVVAVPDAPAVLPSWTYVEPGMVQVPHGVGPDDLLILTPFAVHGASDATQATFLLSRASVARACARGHDPARLQALLLRRCGTLPPDLAEQLTPGGGLELTQQTVLLSANPADLALALRHRSVRRAVRRQVAPGVALVGAGQAHRLAWALARTGRTVTPPPSTPPAPVAGLSPGDAAALVLAATFYQAHAPLTAPLRLAPELLDRLRADLPPVLAEAAETAAASALRAAAAAAPVQEAGPDGSQDPPHAGSPAVPAGTAAAAAETSSGPAECLDLATMLATVRQTLRRRGCLELVYQGVTDGQPQERIVRPLRLERHGPWWYLCADCLRAQGERCFRLDRVHALRPLPGQRSAVPAPPDDDTTVRRRGPPRQPRATPASGFFSDPPAPPPGSPLLRIWLDEG